MARNTFVVSDGLVIDKGSFRKIRSCYYDAAGAFAVWRSIVVVGRGGGLEGRNGFDGNRRLRQQGEKLRQFGLHLRDIAPKVFEDLVRRSGNIFCVLF